MQTPSQSARSYVKKAFMAIRHFLSNKNQLAISGKKTLINWVRLSLQASFNPKKNKNFIHVVKITIK
jgi:hypothetical protein